MAYFAESPLPRFQAGDLAGTVRRLYSFCQELQETLLFVLANLDGDNITGYEEIFNRLEGADGAVSILKQTAEEISAQVRKGTEQIAELSVRADGITQRVSDTEQGVAELRVTAGGISQRVADNAGNIASLQTTASGLTSRVANTEGSLSTIEQTARGLSSTVSDLNGKYTSIKQTVDSIDLEGVVTFTDLSRSGRTEINGDNITTGTIDVEFLNLSNGYGYITLGEGSTGDYDTEGILMCGPRARNISGSGMAPTRYRNHFFASDSGARMTGEDTFGSESIYVCANDIDASIAPANWSDGRLKNSVSYDLAERYAGFFRALKPARFRMNSSRSGRYHTGFIAQQVRDALEAGGLTRQDLAALVQKDYDPEAADGGEGRYSIRYGELIALNTAMVQQLWDRVDTLEGQLQSLKGEV